MNVAMPPIRFELACSAFISSSWEKFSCWIRTASFISSTRKFGHENHLAPIRQRQRHIVDVCAVHCGETNDLERCRIFGLQLFAQILQTHPGMKRRLHFARADAFCNRTEEQYFNHAGTFTTYPSRFQTPLLPPRFSSSWIHSIRIPLSIALHMS